MAYVVNTGNITLSGHTHSTTGYHTTAIPNGGYLTASVTGSSTAWVTGAGTGASSSVNIHHDGIDIKDGGDITLGDISLKDTLQSIHERLAILVPDPKKLKKYEALKQAYDHYKLLEALCNEEDEK